MTKIEKMDALGRELVEVKEALESLPRRTLRPESKATAEKRAALSGRYHTLRDLLTKLNRTERPGQDAGY